MHTNALGTFNISEVNIGTPAMVRLWTNAPINSKTAEAWLKKLCTGEVVDITVGSGYIIMELDPGVYTKNEAYEAVRQFLERLGTAVAELDELDLRLFGGSTQDVLSAMAVWATPRMSSFDDR